MVKNKIFRYFGTWLVRVKLSHLWSFIDLTTEAIILGFGGLRMKASTILVLDWLGTKALYNLGVDGLRIKAASLVELIGLRLKNRSSIHLGVWWV